MPNPRYDYLEYSVGSVTDYFAKDIEVVKGRRIVGKPEAFFDPTKGIFIFKVLSEDTDGK